MTAKAGMPYADTPIAQYLTKQIDALRGVKSQREIAAEIGYEKPNIISMFKRGEMRVPLDKIPALARALHVDPALLFRMGLEQYWPDQRDALNSVFGMIVTAKEKKILQMIRELTEGEPELTPELEAILTQHFKKEDMKQVADLRL